MRMILRIVSVLVGIAEMGLAVGIVSGRPKTNVYQLGVYAAAIIPMFVVAWWLIKFGFAGHWASTEQKPSLR